MASNIKAKPSSKESPTEPFKRAVTGCLRALARKPELEVAFAAERPGLMGGKVRLPEPPRKLGKAEAAVVRGHADSIALRLACHDAAVHRRLQPAGQQARAVFEAVEQARVEAIGSRRMDGVAQNLAAMLDDRFHRGKFDQITERADAPIEDALAMMVRERLTGMAPPPAAKKLVDLWRPLIEDRAGRDLDRLENLVEDQRQFGDAVHDLLDALEMGEDRSRDSEEEEDEGEEERRKQQSGEDGDAADSDEMQRMTMEDTQVSAEDMPDAAAEAAEAPLRPADDTRHGDAEPKREPRAPVLGPTNRRRPDNTPL
jgi:cobaltochelatase CobT